MLSPVRHSRSFRLLLPGPPSDHAADLLDTLGNEFAPPHSKKMEVIGQTQEMPKPQERKIGPVEQLELVPPVLCLDQQIKQIKSRRFDALTQNESLRSGKLVDPWDQP
jgi:hypothetical protein